MSIPPENLWFSDIFRVYKIGALPRNGLNSFNLSSPTSQEITATKLLQILEKLQ